MNIKKNCGFTLMEVMLVVIIIAMLAAVAVPRLTTSAELARQKADITTGREVKVALDRYYVEKGVYPKIGELTAVNGKITGEEFIPQYISKLDSTVTQQTAEESRKGFGIAELGERRSYPEPANLIMLYLTRDGSAAEVRVYNKDLSQIIWSSLE